jgi:hypothetical protein
VYLVVLGNGSWRWHGQTYKAGVHEVSDEVADAARTAGKRSLVVMREKPKLQHKTPGPLTIADLQKPRRGLTLAGAPAQEASAPVEDSIVPLDHPCGQCEKMFPSPGARDRHIEFHHSKR